MSLGKLIKRMSALFHRHLPRQEDFADKPWMAPIASRVLSPELWRFTRRSVPRGVALGLFAGFIIPVGQIFLAGFLALPARANVAVAALVTFVTNPFTLPFWIVVANRIGKFFLHIDPTGAANAVSSGSVFWDDFSWFMRSAGQAAVGFVVLSIVGASIGYLVAGWIWRYWIGHKHRERRARAARGEGAPRDGGESMN